MTKTIHTTLIKAFQAVILFALTLSTPAQASDQISPKIIGGKISDLTAWPWMAGVVTKGKSDFEGQFCGASLIDKYWVLTAAHCVIDEEKDNLDIIIDRAKFDPDPASGERIVVEKIVYHPDYDNITLDNDIALIKLQFPSIIQPITVIASDSILDNAESEAIAIGWGKTSVINNSFPTELYEVELPIVADTNCSSVLSGFTDNMLCAGAGLGNKDTCKGDSGGPLVVFDEESESWHQVGITSWGNGCSKKGFSGVYTRLKNYNTFISDSICPSNEMPDVVSLTLTVNANNATASWSRSKTATGYRLYYAPFPQAEPIQFIDVGDTTQFSAELVPGNAFFVAIVSYKEECLSEFSNIEDFIIEQ